MTKPEKLNKKRASSVDNRVSFQSASISTLLHCIVRDNRCRYNGRDDKNTGFGSTPVSVVCLDRRKIAALKSNYIEDPGQLCCSIFLAWRLSMLLPTNDLQGQVCSCLIGCLSFSVNYNIKRKGNPQSIDGVQHLPSMLESQIAKSSCMGTSVASCLTASHWSYWKTSARPGPCRCANGLRGLLGLSNGASNFSPNHTWTQDVRGANVRFKHQLSRPRWQKGSKIISSGG